MGRVKTGREKKGGKCCLTCLIVSIVILVLFVGGVFIGANVAFSTFVSPHIGGVTLMETLSLLRGLYNADRDAIVTEEFAEADLYAFYGNLNTALFQKPYTEEENLAINQAKYDALSQEEKDNMSNEEKAAFLAKQNYRISIQNILDAVNFGDMVSGGQNDTSGETGELAAAEDADPMTQMLKELLFDFSVLAAYNEDIENAEANLPFQTLTITGKQVAAIINEVATIFLKGESSPLNEVEMLASIDNINEYIKIPQVKISYDKKLEDCDSFEEYEKGVNFSITVEVKLGDIVEIAISQFAADLNSIPPFVFDVVKRIVPKDLFLTVGTYPLDKEKEVFAVVNNFNDKQVATMNTILNAVFSKMNKSEEESGEEQSENSSLLQSLNATVADVFEKIKSQNIALDFVSSEGANGLQLKHIETVLSLMGLIDPDDPYNLNTPGVINSITPHMFLSAMKCLTVSYNVEDEDYDEIAKNYSAEDLSLFLALFEQNYGIDSGYLSDSDVSLLDSSTLQNLPDHISLADNINYSLTPEEMRVFLSDKALAALLADAINSGLLNSGDTAAAEDSMDFVSLVNFNQINITKKTEKVIDNPIFNEGTPEEYTLPSATSRLYEVSLVLSLSLSDLLAGNENEQSELINTVFGSLHSLYVSVAMYIEEIGTEDNSEIYARNVGGEANPASFKINKFSYENTDKVFATLSLMMQKLGNKDNEGENNNPFDITTISTQVEEIFGTVFAQFEDNLKAPIHIANKNLVLPSIYEVISGMVNDKATTEEDKMNATEIHSVFRGIYDSGIEVVDFGETPSPETVYKLEKYSEGVSDAFLASLSNNYYMKEQMDTSALFDSENIGNMLSADSIDFVGANGVYHDSRTLDALSVPMTGDALAALLVESGQLQSISQDSEGGMLKDLEIINAVMRVNGTSLIVDFELVASLDKGSEGGEEQGTNFSGFLPDRLYITASVLVAADSYSVEMPRFFTEVAVNKMESEANNNLFKLLRVLTGEDIDTSSLTQEVKNAMENAFTSLEENINLEYYIQLSVADADFAKVKDALNATYGVDTVTDASVINTIMLANIFNTLNKLSNKEDPLYVPSQLEDLTLRARLQEFGREPEKEHDVSNESGVKYFDNIFALGDSNDFIDNFNRYYYINQNNRMTADGLLSNDGFFATSTSSADSFNFKDTQFVAYPGLYLDTEPYSEATFAVRMGDKALAELVFLGSGETDPDSGVRDNKIALGEDGNYAIITQVKIYDVDTKTYIMMSMQVFFVSDSNEDTGEILPEYLFISVIVDMELLIHDIDNVTGDNLLMLINGMSEEETEDFFERLDKLATSLNFDMAGFDQDSLKNDAAEAIKNGFREISKIDNVTYGEDAEGGYLRLPDVFTYLVNHCEMMEEPTGLKTLGAELCERMREFGRTPETTEDTIESIIYYLTADIDQFEESAVFNNKDANAFLVNFNRNFYFAEDKQITTAEGLFSTSFEISGDSFNFNNTFTKEGVDYDGLYLDSRDYSDLEIRLTQKQLGSLVKQKENGFAVGEDGEAPDLAEIVQFGILLDSNTNQHFLKTIILYSPTSGGNAMPRYIFITSYTNLEQLNEFGDKTYATSILVNDLDDYKTARFFDNMQALQAKLNIDSNVKKEVIENTISDKFRDIFDNQLGTIGNLEWNEGYLKLPNMFEYIVSGDKINEGAGMWDYAVDANGDKVVDASSPTGFATESTTPEQLMLRLRGFGNKLQEGQDINAEGGLTYNDNRYTSGDDEYFYEVLQAYYYLKDKPSSGDIYSGTLFSEIGDSTFNFAGDTANYTNDKPNYYGLYNYKGEQQKARLSDRALAAILASENKNPSTSGMTVSIESLKLYMIGGDLVFEITSKAEFEGSLGDALPEYIYITSFTVRTDNGAGGWDYNTKIVTNRFGVASGNTINLSYNLSQMAVYGIDFDAFDTESVADNISDMVKNALDSLGEGLNIDYKEYDGSLTLEPDEEGVGYIEFKSIYGIIADMTLDTDTGDTTAKTMQSMIVKLHDTNIFSNLVTNPKDEDPSGTDYLITFEKFSGYVTDRYFASMIEPITENELVINIEQALFMSTLSDAILQGIWETRFDEVREGGFAFGVGQDYIIVTGSINLGAFATGNVTLLPTTLYSSLIMNADSASDFDPCLLFNEMNSAEIELFLSIAKSDEGASFDNLSDNIKNQVNDTLEGGLNSLFNVDADGMIFHISDATFPDCVGYLETYKYY